MKPKTQFFSQPAFTQLPQNSRHAGSIATTVKFLLLLILSATALCSFFFYDALIPRLCWLFIISTVTVKELEIVCDESDPKESVFLGIWILLYWWSLKAILTIPSPLIGLFMGLAIIISFRWFKATSTPRSNFMILERPFSSPLKLLILISILVDFLSYITFFGFP